MFDFGFTYMKQLWLLFLLRIINLYLKMKIALSLSAILISGNLFSQTVKITNDVREKGIKEKFYVLKSDNNIKEGPYASYSRYRGQLLCEGFYKNNIRDGIWIGYNYDGQQQVKYDYIHKKLLAFNPPKYIADIQKYAVINGSDTLKTTLDQPPIFVDGNNKIIQLYVSNIRYPAKARESNLQGKVLIAVTVDTLGHLSNYRVKKSVGGGCDEEALRVVKLIDGDWLPGMLNGKPVTVEYELPISFTLQSD
jgi:TonB family protein